MYTEYTHMAVHTPEHVTTLTSLNSCQGMPLYVCIMCAMATMTMIYEAMWTSVEQKLKWKNPKTSSF